MAQRLNYVELAPEALGTLRSVEHYLNAASGLESNLLELVRLRASQMNGCEYCMGLHAHELTKRNEPEGRIQSVEVWRTSDAYTQRERAALAWTEQVTDIQVEHASDEAFAVVREHFSEKELVDLTVAIASINAWNRVAISFRAQRRGSDASGTSRPIPDDMPQEEDDGGKVTVEEES